MNTNIHVIFFIIYLSHVFLEWEMFQKKVVEKTKTHIFCSVTCFFSLENRAVYDIMLQPTYLLKCCLLRLLLK